MEFPVGSSVRFVNDLGVYTGTVVGTNGILRRVWVPAALRHYSVSKYNLLPAGVEEFEEDPEPFEVP